MTEIQVKYTDLYARVQTLRNQLQGGLGEMHTGYSQMRTSLSIVDGATNAALIQAVEENRGSALMVANTLEKLLIFIDASARQIEMEEGKIASTFINR